MRGLNGFAARIERLEGWLKPLERVHQVTVDRESSESALKRYEQESEIGPNDLVILCIIVDPVKA